MDLSSLRMLRALVVDDIPAPRRVMKRLLAELGISDVDEAGTGAEAKRKLESKEFDIILCDYNLNDATGLEILQFVRADERLSNIPFLIMTSDIDKAKLHSAKEAGVSGYMLKPFNLNHLGKSLVEAVEKHLS